MPEGEGNGGKPKFTVIEGGKEKKGSEPKSKPLKEKRKIVPIRERQEQKAAEGSGKMWDALADQIQQENPGVILTGKSLREGMKKVLTAGTAEGKLKSLRVILQELEKENNPNSLEFRKELIRQIAEIEGKNKPKE